MFSEELFWNESLDASNLLFLRRIITFYLVIFMPIVITVILGVSHSLDSFKPDSASIASRIKYHAEFTPSFSPEHFELPKAYFATAESVRDSLIINWNATYDYYEKINVKQAYYLSMEFLQVISISTVL